MNIVIYGFNYKTDRILEYFKEEELLSKIRCVVGNTACTEIDGIPIVKGPELSEFEPDWIVLCEENDYYVNSDCTIDADVLINNVNIHFMNYLELKKRKVSIVAPSDWARTVYQSLYLKSNSPFTMVKIEPDEYLKLLEDFESLMNNELEFGGDNSVLNSTFGLLGGRIKIYFPSIPSFAEARKKWNSLVELFNWEDYVFEMDNFENYEQVDSFFHIKKREKIAFFYDSYYREGIVKLPEWDLMEIRKKYRWFDNYVKRTAYRDFDGIKPYDVVDLLLRGKV